MENKLYYKLFLAFLFALIGLAILDINKYVVMIALIIAFIVFEKQEKSDYERRVNADNKKLVNRITSSTNDAYLKRKQLVTMVSNIPLPLLLLDKNGSAVMYNGAFEVFKTSDEKKELSYNHNDFILEVAEFVADAFILEKRTDRNMNIGGVEYEAISVPITTEGKFSGCVYLFQDISKAKEKEEMQKQFIADASHELKTPIAAIKGMSEILNREDFNDEETRKEFIYQIEQENLRLEKIVLGLLQLSKLSRDTLILNRRQLDFTDIINMSVNTNDKLLKDGEIELVKDYRSHELVFVDEEKMLTVLDNLLTNAIKYSEQGKIFLRTYNEDDYYVFEISDHGKGMKSCELDHIFDRFYRIDKDRSRFSGGIGIGLSIVKSICDAHDMNITVESKEGKGTTFKIYMKY